jgi:hypothetical protein
VVAGVFLVLRYCPAQNWINGDVYGWLIDKWHLGPIRVLNFSALALLAVRYGDKLAAPRIFAPLARLGRASIEVFSVQVLCCLGANALNHDADPHLPWWQQVLVLGFSMWALFMAARAHEYWTLRRETAKTV